MIVRRPPTPAARVALLGPLGLCALFGLVLSRIGPASAETARPRAEASSAAPAASPRGAGPVASLGEVFRRVNPSVVLLRTRERERLVGKGGGLVQTSGIGSGVLVDGEGHVVTAAHVVQLADEIDVEFPGGETTTARVEASDPAADLALLRIEKMPAKPVISPLGDSDSVSVGDQIFVVGSPLGLQNTLTVGYVGARVTDESTGSDLVPSELLQTDAAVQPGNSGGPAFDLSGQVIGIVSKNLTGATGPQGLGFLVSARTVRERLLERRPAWTGMEGYLLSGALAAAFHLPQSLGVLVQRVAKDSPADRLGLRGGSIPARVGDDTIMLGGDVVLGVDDVQLTPETRGQLRKRLSQLSPGEKLTVVVYRAGKVVPLEGTLAP